MIKRLFVVKVLLGGHIVMLPAQGRPIGYHQRFGVTAESESEALALVRNYVIEDTGCSIAGVENQGEPDFDGEDAEIKHLSGGHESHGIWYKSGRAFYRRAEEEGESSGLPN